MASIFPVNDLAFSKWLEDFARKIGEDFQKYGLTDEDMDALQSVYPAWSQAHSSYLEAKKEIRRALGGKRTARANAEKVLRHIIGRIQSHPRTSNADRAYLRLKLRNGNSSGEPVIGIIGIPEALININSRLKHVIRINNQTPTGYTRRKPSGVLGCEVWRRIDGSPNDFEGLEFAGLITRNPHVIEYDAKYAGKQAHYFLRWVSRKGEKGSWSPTVSATIAA